MDDIENIDIIDMQKTINPEKVIDVLDYCIERLCETREKIRQELYYDEF